MAQDPRLPLQTSTQTFVFPSTNSGLEPQPQSKATEPLNLLRVRETQGFLLLWFVAVSFALLLSVSHISRKETGR